MLGVLKFVALTVVAVRFVAVTVVAVSAPDTLPVTFNVPGTLTNPAEIFDICVTLTEKLI
jgi:hypothetical protein